MDKFQGTPGPWEVAKTVLGEPAIASAAGDHIANLPVMTVNAVSDEQRTANARLIAAAPDLLKAAEDLLVICKEVSASGNTAFDLLKKHSINQGALAIAKALGKEIQS